LPSLFRHRIPSRANAPASPPSELQDSRHSKARIGFSRGLESGIKVLQLVGRAGGQLANNVPSAQLEPRRYLRRITCAKRFYQRLLSFCFHRPLWLNLWTRRAPPTGPAAQSGDSMGKSDASKGNMTKKKMSKSATTRKTAGSPVATLPVLRRNRPAL
jgi:hypothetical protein